MATQPETDLPRIARELARTSLRLRFRDDALERSYTAEAYRQAGLHNRVTICICIAIFDVFIIPEMHGLPEVVVLSAFLRFALLTPATIAFVVLSWRGLIDRWTPAFVTALLIAPTLIAALESTRVISPAAVSNYETVPLVQLVVLTCRLNMRQAFIINIASCLLYTWTMLTARFVPPEIMLSLILKDVAVSIATLVFAWRIDLRDRQVYLFRVQAALGRELLAAQNRSLERLSQMDALTGLGNRRCFDETMATLWSGACIVPATITLILFDIDCFKQFNDTLGHQAGDECLGAVARAVARCLRDERDVLVRYGGEEFAIILPDTSLEEGCAVAERVRTAVVDRALPHPGGGPHHLVTISLGVATVLAPQQSSSSLVEAADQLLYTAKRAGRNRVAGETRVRIRAAG